MYKFVYFCVVNTLNRPDVAGSKVSQRGECEPLLFLHSWTTPQGKDQVTATALLKYDTPGSGRKTTKTISCMYSIMPSSISLVGIALCHLVFTTLSWAVVTDSGPTIKANLDTPPKIVRCWLIVLDVGSTLHQHWVDVSCLYISTSISCRLYFMYCTSTPSFVFQLDVLARDH